MILENCKTVHAYTLIIITASVNNMDKDPIVFVEGMSFRSVPPTAPETVRGSISFKVKEMMDFLQKNVDGKGWVNIKMMKSKEKGSIYFILDTYKPKTDPVATQEYNNTKYRHEDPQVQVSNEKSAEQIFNKPLNEDEQFALSQIPF